MRTMHSVKKKGQAAFEFLITYGWAFLLLLVVIGTFVYFGVLDPSRVLPDRCVFDTPFACEDSAATTMGVLAKLRNTVGTVKLVRADVICQGIGTAVPTPCSIVNNQCTLNISQESSTPEYWVNGESREFFVQIAMPSSARPKCTVEITYVPTNQQFEKTAVGTIMTRVT